MVKEADFIQQAVAEAKLFFSFASATFRYYIISKTFNRQNIMLNKTLIVFPFLL
jgi:hypothetical protein